MATGMWTAAAGASAQSQNLEVIANNLANSDSAAYKKDIPTFKEYLSVLERQHEGADIPHGPIKDKDLYPLDGKDQAFVVMDGTHVNYEQGSLRVTQAQFDLAMDGPGFLEISTPEGIRFTRQGSLKIGPDGRLLTTQGHPVLAAEPAGLTAAAPTAAGADVAARFINVRDRGTHFSINGAGEIYSGDELIAKFSVAEFQDLRKLKKLGAQVFENRDPANRIPVKNTLVRQGMIETSNVNPIQEMTNLIKANRLFEQDLKALKTFNELMGREANDVGKL